MIINVLIVEANPVARAFLARVVRDSFSDTIVIDEVGNLEAARRLTGLAPHPSVELRPDPYRLMLLDLELPDGNGLEFLAALATYPATKVVTSLYSDDEHLFPALQCGADGYLLKEDRLEVLIEELQKIVRGQPPLSPAIARRLLSHFRQGHALEAPVPRPEFHLPQRDAPAPIPMDPADKLECSRLTPRENEVLTYLSKGFTIKEIAGLTGLKWFTVNDHIKSIYKKLNVSSRAEAAVLASKHGLV